MKILFVAVFDEEGKSTNNSQANAFESLGHTVVRYNYRARASKIGNRNRNLELIDTCRTENPDITLFAKTNTVSMNVFEKCKKISVVGYWFPDPLQTFQNHEFIEMTKISDFMCCDKINVLNEALKLNDKCYHVTEGYDSTIESVLNNDKVLDVSFIGSVYGNRAEILGSLKSNVHVTQDAYDSKHSEVVSSSKINLNICTSLGASDRVYKILAAGGFLLTDDWTGREEMFEDEKHLVIYHSIDDLNQKIDYYLANPDLRDKIAKEGNKEVQKYSRLNWAAKIVKIASECQS
jgi:spore maturation protein CgeB